LERPPRRGQGRRQGPGVHEDEDEECCCDDYDWDELNEEERRAAAVIGYDREKWDNDDGSDSDFSLDEESTVASSSKIAAKKKKKMSSSNTVTSGGARSVLSGKSTASHRSGRSTYSAMARKASTAGDEKAAEKNKKEKESKKKTREPKVSDHHSCLGSPYEDMDWRQLPKDIKAAAVVLGYSRRIWDNDGTPASDDKDWSELTREEKSAAKIMGYTKHFWDQDEREYDLMEHTIRGWDTWRAVWDWDRESGRIMRLAVPDTVEADTVEVILGTFLEAVLCSLVSYYMGPEVFAAYAIVETCLSFTSSFVEGMEEAEEALVAQAVGLGNYFLAGQYVQLTSWGYVFFYLPTYALWILYMDDLVRWVGLGDHIAQMAGAFVPVIGVSYFVEGLVQRFDALLRCDGKAVTVAVVNVFFDVSYTVHTALYVVYFNANLNGLAYIEMAWNALFGVFIVALSVHRGWLQPYAKGLVMTNSLNDWRLVKTVAKVCMPLSLSAVLFYGEWELLTMYAAYMGAAEVVAWSIVDCFWEIFEEAPAGLTSAAIIRIGIHLGNGNPRMAKISAYKSLFYSLVWSATLTVAFMIFSPEIIGCYTRDYVLTTMIQRLVTMVAASNVLFCLGNDSWHILVALGRTKLATSIYFASTWLLTLPLCTWFVFGLGYNLEGLVSAMIVGYATLDIVLLYLVFTTNWKKVSMKIIAKERRLTQAAKEDLKVHTGVVS